MGTINENHISLVHVEIMQLQFSQDNKHFKLSGVGRGLV